MVQLSEREFMWQEEGNNARNVFSPKNLQFTATRISRLFLLLKFITTFVVRKYKFVRQTKVKKTTVQMNSN